MKVIIPMAGYGTRLRPHTYSRPKPLINVAGVPMLKHLLDSIAELDIEEYIFIVGYLGKQIETYVTETFDIKATFVVQEEMIGQAHAIYLAREHLNGEALVLFADTLFETDLSVIKTTDADAVVFVKEVEDPRPFGVVKLDKDGVMTEFKEKPKTKENKLAVIGLYYLKDSQHMIRAIETQMERKQMTKGEFFIADAFQIMIDEGAKFKTQDVSVWKDCGKPETVLDTNQYLLENGLGNGDTVKIKSVTIIPPVYIDPTATLENAIIGPHTTVSAGCIIKNSIIRDSIIDRGAVVTDSLLDKSLVGQNAKVLGGYRTMNVGDGSQIGFS